METRIRRIHPAVWLLAVVILVSFIVRIRLLDAPLERDEGEHAYTAQAMLAGNPPWKLAYDMKLPGTDALYAIFIGVFGQTAAAIRVGLLIVNTATILLIALLGRRLFGLKAGISAAACYGVLSLSQNRHRRHRGVDPSSTFLSLCSSPWTRPLLGRLFESEPGRARPGFSAAACFTASLSS